MKNSVVVFLAALVCVPALASSVSAQLDVGSSIGVDFSTAEGVTGNWNAPALNGTISNVVALDGSTISGVTFSTSGASGENDAPADSGNLPGDFPLQVEGDWWFDSGAGVFTFEFTGMDRGLVYSLTIGTFRSTTVTTQIANGSTSWVVGGNTMTTVVNDPSAAFVQFDNLVADANGIIRITSADNNGNTVGAVAALRLDVTGGEPLGPTEPPQAWGPTGPRAPAGQVSLNPLLFDATDPAVVDATVPTEMPNVLIIYADDWGFGDCSVNFPANSPRLLATPNIDRIAAEGRNFTDSHSSSGVCTPSRYSLLTGNYPYRALTPRPVATAGNMGISGPAVPVDGLVFDENEKTIGDVMKQAGYTTSWIGKWHLGFGEPQARGAGSPKWNNPQSPGPNEVGLDYFYGIAAANSLPPYLYIENDTVVGLDPSDPIVFNQDANTERQADWGGQNRGRKDTLNYYGGADAAHALYSDLGASEEMTNRAKQWLTDNHEDPFFMVFSTTAIHHPFTPARNFEGTSLCGIYGDYVHELDWIVGEVMNHLQELGVADETLVIITSDNGGMSTNDPGTVAVRDFEHQLNGNFLGYKFGVWEGGHRVPFIARWPGKIPAGTVSDEMFSQTDLMKTMANMVNVSLTEDDARDSFDVMEILTGNPTDPIRDSIFYSPRNDARRSIRMGDWVYIPSSGDGGFGTNIQRTRYLTDYYGIQYNHLSNGSIVSANGANSTQLYNLAVDPYQQTNVVNDAANAAIVAELIDLRNDFLTGDRTAPFFILGDVNRDGFVTFLDISPFIALLTDTTFQIEADTNLDGVVNFLDISSFIDLLTGNN